MTEINPRTGARRLDCDQLPVSSDICAWETSPAQVGRTTRETGFPVIGASTQDNPRACGNVGLVEVF